ncbi:MAG: dihydroneopterin aldolase [Bacteroidetes bacterium]|jgi:dihydroneopterin aldolase|nr:dihydroneopterin aldolase [Bacteroidota bacterium]
MHEYPNNRPSGRIGLYGMEFYAHHGVGQAERLMGRSFIVDLSLDMEVEGAALYDDLEKTADYEKMYQIVKAEMAVNAALMETVARRIAWRIKNLYPKAKNIELTIKKISPFIGGKCRHAEVKYFVD